MQKFAPDGENELASFQVQREDSAKGSRLQACDSEMTGE